ncbi:collagenase-like [Anticarsia gemmatalis]|uniref:collagenase-like n=1 Tax=Anticarsia gemmatalis TaxID=129554 RepID=UPI003F764515
MYIKLILSCLALAQAQNITQYRVGYHQVYGVPNAERIRIQEAVGSRVAGGSNAALGKHTYMAGLIIRLTTSQVSMCGGTLLNQQRVLTAAACWDDGHSQGMAITVVLGSTKLFSGGKRVEALEVRTHPSYYPGRTSKTLANLAMLVIDPVLYSSTIKPLMLPTGLYISNTFTNSFADLVGYGITPEGSKERVLKEITLKVLSNNECKRTYGPSLPTDALCANSGGGKGACGGDIGGPLVLRNFDGRGNHMLIGVTLFDPPSGCGSADPSGFTRVSLYSSWIQCEML